MSSLRVFLQSTMPGAAVHMPAAVAELLCCLQRTVTIVLGEPCSHWQITPSLCVLRCYHVLHDRCAHICMYLYVRARRGDAWNTAAHIRCRPLTPLEGSPLSYHPAWGRSSLRLGPRLLRRRALLFFSLLCMCAHKPTPNIKASVTTGTCLGTQRSMPDLVSLQSCSRRLPAHSHSGFLCMHMRCLARCRSHGISMKADTTQWRTRLLGTTQHAV